MSNTRMPQAPPPVRPRLPTLITTASLLLLLLLLLLSTTVPTPVQAKLLRLTDATFDSVHSETFAESGSTSLLVLFQSDQCHHCRAMLAEYELLSDDPTLQRRTGSGTSGTSGAGDAAGPSSVLVTTIDGPTNRALTVRFGITSYPSLLYLHNNRMYHYRGGDRTRASMRAFVLKGYENQGEGMAIPPPLDWTNIWGAYARAAYAELVGAARGDLGVVGYGLVVLTGFVVGLVGVAVYVAVVLMTRNAMGAKKEY